MKGLQFIQRDDILAARSSLRSRKNQQPKTVDKPQKDDPREMFQKELSKFFLTRQQKNGDSLKTKLPNGKNITVGRTVEHEGDNQANIQGEKDKRIVSDDNNSVKTLTNRGSSQSSDNSRKSSVISNSSQISNSHKLEKTSVVITQARNSPEDNKKTIWRTNIDVHKNSSLKGKEQQSWTPEQDLNDFEEVENTSEKKAEERRTLTSNGFKSNLVPGSMKKFSSFSPGISSVKNQKKNGSIEDLTAENEKPLIVWDSQDSLLSGSTNPPGSNWYLKSSDTSDMDSTSQTHSKRKSEKKNRKKEEVSKKTNRSSIPPTKEQGNSATSGIVYGGHGEILLLPGFKNIPSAENDHVIDETAGNAPKWRNKKKKYAFQSTVKLNEKEKLELELASRIQAQERQMEEERLAQQRTELEFRKMRMYMCYPNNERNGTSSASVSRTNSSQPTPSRDVSRSVSTNGEGKETSRHRQQIDKENEMFVARSDDGAVLQQVKEIGDSTHKFDTDQTSTQTKKRHSKSGNGQPTRSASQDRKVNNGLEQIAGSRLNKKTGQNSKYTGLQQINNAPGAGLMSNPAMGASLPNLTHLNDYLKLLSATQIVPPFYQHNLNPTLFANNPNLIQQMGPFYPLFINPMANDPNNILGGLNYDQTVPNGVQNPMYTSDDDSGDEFGDTESSNRSLRTNSNYTSSWSSDQTKDLDNSYSTQCSSVANTSTEYSRDNDKSSDSGGNQLTSETEISTQSSNISSNIDRQP